MENECSSGRLLDVTKDRHPFFLRERKRILASPGRSASTSLPMPSRVNAPRHLEVRLSSPFASISESALSASPAAVRLLPSLRGPDKSECAPWNLFALSSFLLFLSRTNYRALGNPAAFTAVLSRETEREKEKERERTTTPHPRDCNKR